MDFVKATKVFNLAAGNPEEFDPKKVCLYIGLVFEEVAELVSALSPTAKNKPIVQALEKESKEFKKYAQDFRIASRICKDIDRVEFLDGAVDTAVVALGAGMVVGADIEGAAKEVADNNLSKLHKVSKTGGLLAVKDESGKITKPPHYVPVSLERYLRENELLDGVELPPL